MIEKRRLESLNRLKDMFSYESLYVKNNISVCGIDEAGRGPLAGPVVAGCVFFDLDFLSFLEKGDIQRDQIDDDLYLINDSKKMTEKSREKAYEAIIRNCSSFSCGIVDNKTIDKINILNATKKAMKEAYMAINPHCDGVLIDAVKIELPGKTVVPIIKGDSKSFLIAAASIIAKVTRDRLMDKFHDEYPNYGFNAHKGYGTASHIEAIKKFGLSPIHRISYCNNFSDFNIKENQTV